MVTMTEPEPTGWNHPRPTDTMRRDYFTPWAHDRGRQTEFAELPGTDPRWHPLADRNIEAELIALTGKTLIEAELDLLEAWEQNPPPWIPQPEPATRTAAGSGTAWNPER